jgi:tetratricopeptide (TPR) repeat protein
MDLSSLKDFVKDLTQSADRRAISKGLKLYAKGEIAKAIDALKEGHEKSPASNEILFELARLLALADRSTEASDALRTILRRSPRAFERVAELIEEVRARHPHVGPLYDAVAEHFIRHEDLKRAIEALERMKAEEIKAFLHRHQGRWETVQKSAPDAKLAKTSLQSAYFLALGHEALREVGVAADIYRLIARRNPEEAPRVLPRLEALLARDYQNAPLRLAVADLFLQAGREDDAIQQYGVALESDARAAAPLADRLQHHVASGHDRPELRLVLASARLAAGDRPGALEALKPLVASGSLLDQVIATLQPLAASEKSGPARRLLAEALARRGQPQSALETLLQVAEEEGLASIRAPLEELAKSCPKVSRVHLLLADIHIAERQADAAAECLRRARETAPGEDSLLTAKAATLIDIDPGSAETHLLLADLLLKSGERDRAVVVLRHLVKAVPAQAGQALARFAVVLKEDPGAARARLGACEACLALGEHPQALEHLNALAGAQPGLAAEFLHAAALLAEAGGAATAPGLAATLRALETRSSLPQAVRFVLAETLFFGGDPAAACALFREVLQGAPERAEEVMKALERLDRDDPRAVEGRLLLASLYLDRRDHEAVERELRRAPVGAALLEGLVTRYEAILQASPDDHAAQAGFVQTLLQARQFDRVMQIGQEAMRRPDDAATGRIAVAMGDALREKGDTGGAVKRYYAAYGRDRGLATDVCSRLEEIVRAEGTQPLASLALGKVLGAESKPAEAVESLRAAVTADPKLRDTAMTELRQIQSSCPGDPNAGLLLLHLLREGRDTAEALKVISTLLDTHPDRTPALVEHLEAIVAADPAQAFAEYELGRALQRLALHPRAAASYLGAFQKDPGLAPMVQKRLQEMIEAAPAAADPYLAACAVHAARGKFKAAAEDLEKALKAFPNESERLLPRLEEIWQQHRASAPIALLFARACVQAKRFERAVPALSEALDRDPSVTDEVAAALDAVVRGSPKSGEARLARGRAGARRLKIDEALADFDRAVRLAPALLPAVIQEMEAIRSRVPDAVACTLRLADLYGAVGRETDARALLRGQLDHGVSKGERLAILIRLWRLSAAAQDEESARAYLDEASTLAPDRRQFLTRVHEAHLALLRARAARLTQTAEAGARRTADLQAAVRALVDLGDLDPARALLDRHAASLDPQEAARLRAEIALRRGDYLRAGEQLRELGPSPDLAFVATRTGDFALAAKTLESLLRRGGDPALETALARVYHGMIEADLLGGRRRLQAETTLTFDTGVPA